MARLPPRRLKHGGGGATVWWGIALIVFAMAAFAGLAAFYFMTPARPQLDAATLCPVAGPRGVFVVLVDTSDDLPETTKRQVLGLLDDQITGLPEFYKLDIRVLDIPGSRSRTLFSKCNPGDGIGLSEWTDNPRIARQQWIESFRRPAREAVNSSIASSKADRSPIMGAIQDIALDQFSAAVVQPIEKRLTIISDMLEFTRDYSQYPAAGDLSYQRFKRSPAYMKFRTDLHDAAVIFEYVQRTSVKIDNTAHGKFWQEWTTDNRGKFQIFRRLQGAG